MSTKKTMPFVTTLKDRCRVCYTCVRECPAKAIRIIDGQAEVVAERCIGCGNCVKVCSQNAKKVLSTIPEVVQLLEADTLTAACIAPSFPAEFPDLDFQQLVGAIRQLGFDIVTEVGFGADLIAREMKRLMQQNPEERYISTACPAVFGFIKRYHPDLLENLAPVVSPMIATARVLRRIHGEDINVVFLGPCISKKIEANSDELFGEIDEVLTFTELRQLFKDKQVDFDSVTPSDFDPPYSGKGTLFPVGRGLLETAGINEDLVIGDVISANGKANFIDAIMEFSSGDVDARFLDVLCCDGCIMGSGMTARTPMFKRRANISKYATQLLNSRDTETWKKEMDRFEDLDLSREFLPFDQRITTPEEKSIREVLNKMGKLQIEDELNCGACGYETCRDHAIAILKGLAESEMCLPYSIEKLHLTIEELNDSNTQLASARQALIQSEKLASMGQLSAGIAHELNNPLGVVLMFAHLLKDEVDQKSDMKEELEMIASHADRAKKIVSGLLHFARQNKVVLRKANVQELIDDSLKSLQIPKSIKVDIQHNCNNPMIQLDREQICQVLINLISNSITAMPEGGKLKIATSDDNGSMKITVQDTGPGIPKEMKNKIFEPFFTTKEIGKGTGLGLAITYGIIKMHQGQINLQSNADPQAGPTGTTFTVTLPREDKNE